MWIFWKNIFTVCPENSDPLHIVLPGHILLLFYVQGFVQQAGEGAGGEPGPAAATPLDCPRHPF